MPVSALKQLMVLQSCHRWLDIMWQDQTHLLLNICK